MKHKYKHQFNGTNLVYEHNIFKDDGYEQSYFHFSFKKEQDTLIFYIELIQYPIHNPYPYEFIKQYVFNLNDIKQLNALNNLRNFIIDTNISSFIYYDDEYRKDEADSMIEHTFAIELKRIFNKINLEVFPAEDPNTFTYDEDIFKINYYFDLDNPDHIEALNKVVQLLNTILEEGE